MDYNYLEAVKEDVEEYIRDEVNLSDYSSRDELETYLNDTLFNADCVTGNASGSYTFNTYKAEEYICHNLELLAEAMEDFDCMENPVKKGAEWCDVTIRCYLLGDAVSRALDGMEEELKEAFGD